MRCDNQLKKVAVLNVRFYNILKNEELIIIYKLNIYIIVLIHFRQSGSIQTTKRWNKICRKHSEVTQWQNLTKGNPEERVRVTRRQVKTLKDNILSTM